jgi:hypothetical protein
MLKNIFMSRYRKPYCLFLFSLLSLSSFGQVRQDFLDTVSERFQKYCNTIPREEIYIHTDRQDYVAGEDVWFSIYLIDRQTSKLSGSGKIAYFEILNPENRPVAQKRIGLENGFGPGQILLPDTISSGIYTLRAYTNWMKNFMPENCFIQRLIIHNPLTGKSFKINRELKSNKGNITRTEATGLVAEIDKQNQENIRIIINSTRDFRLVGGNTCYLFVQTHGVINFKRVVTLSDEVTVVNMPRDILIPGITHITIFSSSGRPVFERLLYTPHGNEGNLDLIVTENPASREKVRLGIANKKGRAAPDKLPELSISASVTGGNSFPGIDYYMIFGSEYGVLPDELLKSIQNGAPADSIDKFLLSMKSTWIDWNKILSESYPSIRYKKETENHFLYGRLINRNTQIPDQEQYLFLSMPGKKTMFQYAKTDKNGDFTFTLPLDNSIRDLIIQPEDAERNNNIRIESSFSDKYPELTPVTGTLAKPESQSSSKLAVNYQVMKIYKSDVLPVKSSPVTFTGGARRFYGKPDIDLLMDDYIKLPVMQEVFFELTPGVFLKKKKSGYEISIADPVENRIYDKPPLLFIDGVIVRDPANIANLDPETVEKIEAVKSRYFVGEYMMYGLVDVITRAGDFKTVTLPDYAVRLPYRAIEPVNSFSSPDFTTPEKKQSRIPDFRNTLYWNPAVKTDNEGNAAVEFWSSDFRSDYEVSIQGITGDGKPVSIKKIIKVQ